MTNAEHTTGPEPSPTQAPTDPPPPPPPPSGGYRRLERRSDDRVFAGVAAGIARYADIDPVIVRIVLAVLAVFGGAGFVLYILGWLLIPEAGKPASIVEARFPRRHPDRPGAAVIALLVIGALLCWPALQGGASGLGVAALIAMAGYLLYTRGRPLAPAAPSGWNPPAPPAPPAAGSVGAPSTVKESAPPAPAGYGAPPPYAGRPAWTPPPPRAPRPRSVLGVATMSVLLIVAGVAVLLDNLSAIDLTARGLLTVELAITGAALILGTWFGRSRLLLFVGVLLAISLALASIGDPLRAGGKGDRLWRPGTVTDLQPEYRLGAGSAVLDLSGLGTVDGSHEVRAEVGAGNLRIVVPAAVGVTVDASAGAGNVVGFGQNTDGFGPKRHIVSTPAGAAGFIHIDAHVGIGEVAVVHAGE